MAPERLAFRVHALQRMHQRRISKDDVRHVIATGEIIEDYPNDTPFPSRLMLGWCGGRPVHVVMADNKEEQQTIIITAYEPDPAKWEPGFKRRKP